MGLQGLQVVIQFTSEGPSYGQLSVWIYPPCFQIGNNIMETYCKYDISIVILMIKMVMKMAMKKNVLMLRMLLMNWNWSLKAADSLPSWLWSEEKSSSNTWKCKSTSIMIICDGQQTMQVYFNYGQHTYHLDQ